jgi:hypothetical protein
MLHQLNRLLEQKHVPSPLPACWQIRSRSSCGHLVEAAIPSCRIIIDAAPVMMMHALLCRHCALQVLLMKMAAS